MPYVPAPITFVSATDGTFVLLSLTTSGSLTGTIDDTGTVTISAPPITSLAVGGTTGQVQYNSASVLGGAAATKIDANGYLTVLPLTSSQEPIPPLTGATVYVRSYAGKPQLAVRNYADNRFMQPHWGYSRVFYVTSQNATNAISANFPIANMTTPTAQSVTNVNFTSSIKRVSYIGSTANGNYGWRGQSVQFWRSSISGTGGFHFVSRLIPSNTSSNLWRFMHGFLTSVLNPVNNDPSAFFNMVGIAKDANDTNYQFMHNDGAGAATKIDTTIPAAAGDYLELTIYAKPSGSGGDITMALKKMNPGATAYAEYNTGASTDLPPSGTFMCPYVYMNAGSAVTTWSLDLCSSYIESDN